MKPTVAPYKTVLGLCTAVLGATAALSPSLRAQTTPAAFPADLQQKIKYVFILYPENRSFDGLYGNIPGVNGLNQVGNSYVQTARTGAVLATLPQPTTSGIPGMSGGPDTRFPTAMPNAPYDLIQSVPYNSMQGDMVHRFYTEQYQINDPNGRYKADPKNTGGTPLSKFSVWSDNPGLVLTHYDAQNLGEGLLGKLYTICDNNFHSGFGGSFLNHQFLIAARAGVGRHADDPRRRAAPATGTNVTVYDSNGYPAVLANNTLSDGFLTNDPGLPAFSMSNANKSLAPGDYWAVNTLRPLRGPAGGYTTANTAPGAPTSNTATTGRLPLQYHDTIGDRLSAAGITWAWYAGGWNDAKAGRANFLFQFHHQPFAFFSKYALATTPVPATATAAAIPGTDSQGSAQFLKDEDADFYPALQSKSVSTDLPRVIFVKPIGQNNNHPGYAAVQAGEDWVSQAVSKIQSSKVYKNSVVFITYDEHGGMWDHAKPPAVDFWGPGLRVPLTVVSPFVKHGFIDHTQYETNSVLTFLEGLYGLPPLNQHDANAIPPLSPFVGQPDLIVRGQARQPFSYTMPAYGQPEPASVTGDLDGLTYNPATGVLSGTPTNSGSYTLQVQTNVNGAVQTTTLRLDVLPAVATAAKARVQPVAAPLLDDAL